MIADGRLIGRERELAELVAALAAVPEGRGGLVLLSGEAGVGKTRLADEAMAGAGLPVFRGDATPDASVAYGPIVAAVRAGLRRSPVLLHDAPLAHHLARLLPELGAPAADSDRAVLFEALRWAFAAIGACGPSIVFLDDLHWADNATLEALPPLAGALEREPVLIVGAYRSDEIPRGHPLRRVRSDLRRFRRLHEIAVEPLDQAGTAALAAQALDGEVAPSLAAMLHDRTQGLPFFVEELATALAAEGRLLHGREGIALTPGDDVPIPETVRDAVLLRAENLSETARRALEVAAVAGSTFDLELVGELACAERGLDEALEHGLIVEAEAGRARFRHALAREALYGDLTWTRRRALHRLLAERLEADGAPPAHLVEHWLAAGETRRARLALAAAADGSCRVHAYRDALAAARRALESWPAGEDEPDRLSLLGRLAHCAQLSGDLGAAAVAWREVAEAREGSGEHGPAAEARRRLAGVHELQGACDRAAAARRAAADGFDLAGQPGEAATERLGAALHHWSAGSFLAARALAERAKSDAERAERLDLRARILGLEGIIDVSQGRRAIGMAAIRAGLSLALDQQLTGVAAELYARLAVAHEHAGDYTGAGDAFAEGIAFCDERGEAAAGQFCLACMGILLHQVGEWDRAVELWQGILGGDPPPRTRLIGLTGLGLLLAQRGEATRARALLGEAAALGERVEHIGTAIYTAAGLLHLAEVDGDHDAVAERWRATLARWERSEDRHYILAPLQWAATYFAGRGDDAEVRAAAGRLARIAAETGGREALASLAHALGEVLLLDGDAIAAAAHFERALAGWRELNLVPLQARTLPRAAAAHVAAGERGRAIECLTEAYRLAKRLGARPLVQETAAALARLDAGEAPVARRLADRRARGGLSPRELEILRLVAAGHTNREIGRDLYLSTRTVDMHVRNFLDKLDCRSRVEATRRAGELGLLA